MQLWVGVWWRQSKHFKVNFHHLKIYFNNSWNIQGAMSVYYVKPQVLQACPLRELICPRQLMSFLHSIRWCIYERPQQSSYSNLYLNHLKTVPSLWSLKHWNTMKHHCFTACYTVKMFTCAEQLLVLHLCGCIQSETMMKQFLCWSFCSVKVYILKTDHFYFLDAI